MTKAVIYIRVAREQDDDPSQGEQLARIFACAETDGWANVAEYVDDTQGGEA